MAAQTEELRTLTVKQLGEKTGIQVWRIQQMVRERKGPPFFRLGRTIRFRAKDVDAWLDQQCNIQNEA